MKLVVLASLVIAVFLSFFVSYGAENAVKNTSIVEMMASAHQLTSDDRDQIEERKDRFREMLEPYDADTSIGDGMSDCDDITDFQIYQHRARGELHDIGASLLVNDEIKFDFHFGGRGFDAFVTTIFKELSLFSMTVTKDEKVLYKGNGSDPKTAGVLVLLLIECTAGEMFSEYAAEVK